MGHIYQQKAIARQHLKSSNSNYNHRFRGAEDNFLHRYNGCEVLLHIRCRVATNGLSDCYKSDVGVLQHICKGAGYVLSPSIRCPKAPPQPSREQPQIRPGGCRFAKSGCNVLKTDIFLDKIEGAQQARNI